mmetsp:Transcript_100343/g.269476  ORF Transcript_100343/g.269476 Transcript_100343/m.269476 type:complete len:200 (+) Transcript_100343:824-1423(+)
MRVEAHANIILRAAGAETNLPSAGGGGLDGAAADRVAEKHEEPRRGRHPILSQEEARPDADGEHQDRDRNMPCVGPRREQRVQHIVQDLLVEDVCGHGVAAQHHHASGVDRDLPASRKRSCQRHLLSGLAGNFPIHHQIALLPMEEHTQEPENWQDQQFEAHGWKRHWPHGRVVEPSARDRELLACLANTLQVEGGVWR